MSLSAQVLESTNPERHYIHDTDVNVLSPMQRMEDTLVYFTDSMFYSAIPDFRIDGNYEFIKTLKRALKEENSFKYPFTKLTKKINILYAPDNSFRIFNWEIVKGNYDSRFYAVVQHADGKLFPLVDISDQIVRGAEDSIFTNTRWLGCLYYTILMKEIDGQRIYFLLGLNTSGLNSDKKIIDPFGLNSNGKAVLGAPMFTKLERGKPKQVNRFILEFQKGSRVSMNWDKETESIMFDHLESQIGDPAKKHTYIADGTYDGLKWNGQRWVMYENVLQINDLQQGNAPVEKPLNK